MTILAYRARKLAEHAHAGQVRKYSGEPYSVHLREVANYCTEIRCRDEVIAAAWLHDTLEDTNLSYTEIKNLFGDEVARLVLEVTDQSKPEDGNRETRKAIDRTHLTKASPDGKTIKLADLLSNGRSIIPRDPHFAVTFMREMRLLVPFLKEGDGVLYQRVLHMLERYEEKAA